MIVVHDKLIGIIIIIPITVIQIHFESICRLFLCEKTGWRVGVESEVHTLIEGLQIEV
jgi:hypothetical protein